VTAPPPSSEPADGAARPYDDRADDAASRLKRAFVEIVLADWLAHGAAAVASVRSDRPQDYLKLVTTLFPSAANAEVSALDELSDEQLGEELAAVLAQLASAGADPGAGAGPAETAQSPAQLPAL
jgi:hypothetical protein